VLIDQRASTSTFARHVLVIKDDPARFVQAVTNQIQIRMSWQYTSNLPRWRAYVDQLVWDVIP
jgi:hypothetical protein